MSKIRPLVGPFSPTSFLLANFGPRPPEGREQTYTSVRGALRLVRLVLLAQCDNDAADGYRKYSNLLDRCQKLTHMLQFHIAEISKVTRAKPTPSLAGRCWGSFGS
eukprot:3214302-Pyramimonas_sp.AAC.1